MLLARQSNGSLESIPLRESMEHLCQVNDNKDDQSMGGTSTLLLLMHRLKAAVAN